MKRTNRLTSFLLVIIFLISALPFSVSGEEGIPESGEEGKGLPGNTAPEEAELGEGYGAYSIWVSESEGTVNLYDRENNPLELEKRMRIPEDTVLETEEDSLAVLDMDRERLAIVDEFSRAGFAVTDYGNKISIVLENGAMYFRAAIPLEEHESFEIMMEDIILSIRGTCGMVQQDENGMSIVMASGRGTVRRSPEHTDMEDAENTEGSAGPENESVEPSTAEPMENPEEEEILIEAGEALLISREFGSDEIRFEKRKLTEEEVPRFLRLALEWDPEQLDRVFEESGWSPERLLGGAASAGMPAATLLDQLPPELAGKILYEEGSLNGARPLERKVAFPSASFICRVFEDPLLSKRFAGVQNIETVRQFTEHLYVITSGNGETMGILYPGITDSEIEVLKNWWSLEPLKDRWTEIQTKNQYVVLLMTDEFELAADDILLCRVADGNFGELPEYLTGKQLFQEIRWLDHEGKVGYTNLLIYDFRSAFSINR